MPVWPQHQTAALAESANIRVFATDAGDTDAGAITAAPGDVIVVKQVANVNDDVVYTVTLPAVSAGGPVCVKMTGLFGGGSTVTIIPVVADTVAGALIDGFGSITLNNTGDEVVLTSDGAQWWTISKYHNTHDTF